jgi:hypothetical protein
MSESARAAAVRKFYRDAEKIVKKKGIRDFVLVVTPLTKTLKELPAFAIGRDGRTMLTPLGQNRAGTPASELDTLSGGAGNDRLSGGGGRSGGGKDMLNALTTGASASTAAPGATGRSPTARIDCAAAAAWGTEGASGGAGQTDSRYGRAQGYARLAEKAAGLAATRVLLRPVRFAS